MILSSVDIKQYLRDGKLLIDPPPEEHQIDTTTIDLRFGRRLWRWNPSLVAKKGVQVNVDVDNFDFRSLAPDYLTEVSPLDSGQYVIEPNKFYLGETYERVKFPIESCIAARVEGKSRLARLGLVIHMTAPTIHCGYGAGIITLEIYNYGPFPLLVTPAQSLICQLIIEKVSSQPEERVGRTFMEPKTATGI